MIKEGRTVGITGPSHAVICNLIDAVFKHAVARDLAAPRVGQRADKDNPFLHPGAQSLDYPKLVSGLADGDLDVAAGTTWMWSRPDLQSSVDTLFVDEAGQMSLADVLAVAGAARNVVLLGDPQQLAHPSQAAHPPGSGGSALEHILGDRATMPPHAGLLIDKTWRMHPDLCRFTSETFYDGKLTGVDGLELQEILGDPPLSGAGLRVIEVPHEGNTNASPEEAAVVADLVRNLLGRQWRNRSGELAPIGVEQIMVVTPYNAQIRAIQSAAADGRSPPPPGRHGRQVPRPRSSRRHLLDGNLIRRRRSPRHGVPLRPAPPERRNLPSPRPGRHRRQPRPRPRSVPHAPPDAPSQRPLRGMGVR